MSSQSMSRLLKAEKRKIRRGKVDRFGLKRAARRLEKRLEKRRRALKKLQKQQKKN